MRKINVILAACLVAGFLIPATTQAAKRVCVRFAPPKPKSIRVVKVNRPYKNSIWVAGHWSWNGKKYVWIGGKWISPRKGYVYIPGHWKHSRHGWYFVEGHWKKA